MAKDQEKVVQVFGGLSGAQIDRHKAHMDSLESKMSELRGEMGADVKSLEEAGGNKAAFKLARKLSNMEKDKARDFLNSLDDYLEAMGVFKQLEMFDKQEDKLTRQKVPAAVVANGEEVAKAYQQAH